MDQKQEKISVQAFISNIENGKGAVDCIGLPSSAAAYLASKLFKTLNRSLFLIVPDLKAAESLEHNLGLFLTTDAPQTLQYPAYNILPYKFISYHNETAARRIGALYRLMVDSTPQIVIATVEALLQRVIPRQVLNDYAELLLVGEDCERDRLIEKLVSGGYTRTAIVEEPGDFSVRGGILDVFSPLYSNPLRIEFFGDTVDAIRTFSAMTQRKIQTVSEVIILPATEAVLQHESLIDVIGRIRQRASDLELPVGKIRKLVDRIKQEENFPGFESLIPLIYSELDTVFDYIPESALMVLCELEEIEKQTKEFQERISNNYFEAVEAGRLCVTPEKSYLTRNQAWQALNRRRLLRFRMFPVLSGKIDDRDSAHVYQPSVKNNSDIRAKLKDPRNKENLFLPLVEWIKLNRQRGCKPLIVCRSKGRAERLKSLLTPYGIRLRLTDGIPISVSDGTDLHAALGLVSEGFVWPDERLAVITEDEVFGTGYRRQARPKPKMPSELIAIEDLKQGDHIVHVEHGIGRYDGLVKLKLEGTANDYLLVCYKGEDKLYLPVDRMNMIQKYMGIEGITPTLDKMGGKSWGRVKARVKKSAEKLAGDLLKLYAARKVTKGIGFDTVDQDLREFEAAFPYDETTDQMQAIADIRNDMVQATPMDRLVCGDVGYGKTEVALRASFIAVYNGKQVAMLVPTTVLAEQHHATFTKRFKRFPVRVACLSRFRSKRTQQSIVKDIKAGKIDIVIGTHRLLSKDVAFKDLGLLVLDEEQRFGVKHKEKLKTLRRNVDVLTLTATPIPRTLHLSLMGIRDISVISTPPEHRRAIVTYISEFDDAVAVEAIRKELRRKGQIFFIHNSIDSIGKTATKIKDLVPEVRLDIAHGRLGEDELEQVMLRFLNREIDLLVCTTIVESGLDIPAANTIIVNRADRFGLAQMYQLRGRVGRSDEQAYAYLFIPHESLLSKDAQKRLKVLMEHSDLGSGFQIAMSDLQIRGGGNILGASQAGHIAAVGYELFLELMENAIAEIKGEPIKPTLSPEINIRLSTFLPEAYIPDIDQRLSAYRRLARMTDVGEIADYKRELIDRYGRMPEEATNLLLKIMLKVHAQKAGVKRLDMDGATLLLTFSDAHQIRPAGIVDLIVSEREKYEFTPDHVLKVRLNIRDSVGLLGQAKNILKDVARHVNN